MAREDENARIVRRALQAVQLDTARGDAWARRRRLPWGLRFLCMVAGSSLPVGVYGLVTAMEASPYRRRELLTQGTGLIVFAAIVLAFATLPRTPKSSLFRQDAWRWFAIGLALGALYLLGTGSLLRLTF